MLPCHMLSSHSVLIRPFARSFRPLTSAGSVPSVLRSPFPNSTVSLPNDKPLLYSLFSLFRKNHAKLNPSFSISSALFKKECSRNPFPINNFRTLLQNTGGGSKYLYLVFSSRFTAPPATPIPPVVYAQLSSYPGWGAPQRANLSRDDGTIQPSLLPTTHYTTIHYSLPFQKQAPSPPVKQPSGPVCPGGA